MPGGGGGGVSNWSAHYFDWPRFKKKKISVTQKVLLCACNRHARSSFFFSGGLSFITFFDQRRRGPDGSRKLQTNWATERARGGCAVFFSWFSFTKTIFITQTRTLMWKPYQPRPTRRTVRYFTILKLGDYVGRIGLFLVKSVLKLPLIYLQSRATISSVEPNKKESSWSFKRNRTTAIFYWFFKGRREELKKFSLNCSSCNPANPFSSRPSAAQKNTYTRKKHKHSLIVSVHYYGNICYCKTKSLCLRTFSKWYTKNRWQSPFHDT